LYDIDLAMADPDQHCDHDINVETEFEIDEEGAELFFSFELENALCMYHQDDELLNPMAGLHYLLRLGVLSINKGGHSTWFKMMQMGNQIWRHGIRRLLSDPEALIMKLEANAITENKEHKEVA
jgi:DNA sulfur modification protein DndC